MVQKTKINVKDRFSDGEIDLSMSDLDEVPVKEIVSSHTKITAVYTWFFKIKTRQFQAALRKTVSLDLSNNRLTSLPVFIIIITNPSSSIYTKLILEHFHHFNIFNQAGFEQ